MKKPLSLLLSLAMVFSLAACSNSQGGSSAAASASASTPAPEQSAAPAQSESAPEAPEERSVTVTDMGGNEVTITGEVNHIVNLWPSATTSFYVMGAGDLISGLATMGTSGWSPFFYPGCADIPSLGGTSPAVEELAAQDPDLVILHPTSDCGPQLAEMGIPSLNINYSNYEEMIQAYTALGQVLGGEYQEKLDTWCSTVREKLDSHRELVAGLADEDKPVVYYIAGQADDLLTTMPAGQIMQDWIESNGGIFASTQMEVTGNGLKGSNVTAEEVFRLNPDIIIVGGAYQHTLMAQLQSTEGWKDLDAVKNGKVFNNPYGCWNWDRFGLESLLQLDYALLRIQPELAAENGITEESMTQEVIDFYAYYNGAELTEEQAGYMMAGLLWDGTAEVAAQ